MRRVGRRREKRQAGWWALIVATLVGLAIVVVLIREFQPPSIDKTTLCPKETGPVAGVVILLDLTDPLSPTQHARLRGILEAALAEAEANTLFAVGAVRTDPTRRGAEFKLCKPLEGKEANELYQNSRLVQDRYRKEFKRPLDSVLEEMLAAEAANRSPIMESLQALLASTPGFLDAEYPRRVLIVSDLLQHSAAFSFYRGGSWRTFIRSSESRRQARNMTGIDVEIYRMPRSNTKIDIADVEDFWVNYFDRANVQSLSTRPLGDL